MALASPSPPASSLAMTEGPEYGPSKEFRFAVVMYGGVSLAIYIYGASRELFNLVRATAPGTPEGSGTLAFPSLSSTDAVYRRLAQIVGTPPETKVPDNAKVRCRFVVDIISGTSAGGLNGICLATALAADRAGADEVSLDGLESLWVDEGDLGRLVADDRSTLRFGPDGQPERDAAGRDVIDDRLTFVRGAALLNPRRLLVRLTDTLASLARSVDETDPCWSRLVDELDLWVTATDLGGRRISLPLANATAAEADHATRFHFRYDRLAKENDFIATNVPFLGFAGRCTASFPVAFEPMSLETMPPTWPLVPAWSQFYRRYQGADPEFEKRFLSDGGILDNKPFSYATQSLVERRATLPVIRRMLYVEPDPGDPPTTGAAPPDALATALAALTGIPRTETIHADIETVLQRNFEIERAQEVLALAGMGDVANQERLRAFVTEGLALDDWLQLSVAELLQRRADLGPTYATYHRLKIRGVVDYLAACLALALGQDRESEHAAALRYVVRAWKRGRYETPDEPTTDELRGGGPPLLTENMFLFHFDVPYRIRRLSYVLDRLRELELGDEEATRRILAVAGVLIETLPPEGEDARERVFETVRAGLSDALAGLTAIERQLEPGPEGEPGEVAIGLAQAGIDTDWLRGLLRPTDDATRVDDASQRVPAAPAAFRALDLLRGSIEDATGSAREFLDGQEPLLGKRISERELGEDVTSDLATCLKYVLRFHFEAFEALDLVLLPLSFGTRVAKTNAVEIFRISPIDSKPPAGVTKTRLMGAEIHHFGGFFDRSWRAHDIAWGRINAATTLIRSVLGDDDPRATELITDAHRCIIDEYRAAADAGPPAENGWLGGIAMPAHPATELTAETLQRAGLAAGEVASSVVRGRTQEAGSASATVALLRKVLPPNPPGLPAVATVIFQLGRFVPSTLYLVAAAVLIFPLLVLALFAMATDSATLAWITGIVSALELGVVAGALVLVVAVLWLTIAFAHRFILQRVSAALGVGEDNQDATDHKQPVA